MLTIRQLLIVTFFIYVCSTQCEGTYYYQDDSSYSPIICQTKCSYCSFYDGCHICCSGFYLDSVKSCMNNICSTNCY